MGPLRSPGGAPFSWPARPAVLPRRTSSAPVPRPVLVGHEARPQGTTAATRSASLTDEGHVLAETEVAGRGRRSRPQGAGTRGWCRPRRLHDSGRPAVSRVRAGQTEVQPTFAYVEIRI